MLVPTVWVAVCLASKAVMAVSSLDKPYYNLDEAEYLFRDFVKEHGKVYDTKEYFERFEIFKESLNDINERNEKYPHTVFKLNYQADWKFEELYGRHLRNSNFTKFHETPKTVTIPDGPLIAPPAFDWRTRGKVTGVKNSGENKYCRNANIFSAVGNIESQFAIKYNKLLRFSEAQVQDCCISVDSCSFQDPYQVMDELAAKPGLMLEDDYSPYVPERGHCHEDYTKVAASVSGFIRMHSIPERLLKEKLYEMGPLSVCIQDIDFQFYHEGIVEPDKCINNIFMNRCVLLVGYGEENDIPFWTLKFDHGDQWGEAGYARLHRGLRACHINAEVVTAIID